jgi:U5 small nuclear ribonucleoprotein component
VDDGSFISREEFFLSKTYRKERQSLLIEQCGWDALAARNLWAFGPDWTQGTNILLNDTLPDQVGKDDLMEIRESVVQGFQWATREGPLIEEPVRNCKLKLMDVTLATGQSLMRGTGQIIPAVCRSIYGSILTASPRLMEPVYMVEIDCTSDCVQAVFNVLSKRRGHVIKDGPKPGTPLQTMLAFLPIIESFGFETDLRLHTHGQGFCVSWFDHWSVVPGDPLDTTINIRPLEKAPQQLLARDFLLKTRRRKGLCEDVIVEKYIDDVVALGFGSRS